MQLCQWLTLSVRDYHATPLGLVALLQLPGVAMKAMKSQAKAGFYAFFSLMSIGVTSMGNTSMGN